MTLGDNNNSKKRVGVAAAFVLAFVACGPVVGCGGDDGTEGGTTPTEDTGGTGGDTGGPVDTGTTPTDTGSDDTGSTDTGATDTGTVPTDPTATPAFMPPPGTYMAATAVTITSSTAGAVIYYTTDGTDPNISSPKYSAPINLTTNTTIKAMALAPGFTQSAIVTGVYTIAIPTGDVAPVTFSPAAGTYDNDQTVALASTTPAATICYTLDGTAPTCDEPTAKCSGSSATYSASAPININVTGRQIRAIACKLTMKNSSVTSASYTLTAASAVFTPSAGTYDPPGVNVTASLATVGGTIRYTTDGTDPNCTTVGSVFPAVGGTLPFTANTTLKAITCKANYNPSPVQTIQYNVRSATPTATPAAGARNNETTVALAAATGTGGIICYRTDATDPTCTSGATPACGTGSTLYAAGAPKFDANTTVRAVSCDATHVQSAVLTAAYNMVVAPLTFASPDGTAYASATNPIVISTATTNTTGDAAADNVKIHYTLDGSAPTCATPSPTGVAAPTCTAGGCSLSVPKTLPSFPVGTTVRAIACKTDYASASGSATYASTAALPQPLITPTAGAAFINDQSITMDRAGGPGDSTICYTMGTSAPGATPTCTAGVCDAGSLTYNASSKPVANQSGLIIKAIQCKAGQTTSGVSTEQTYTFNVANVHTKLNSTGNYFCQGTNPPNNCNANVGFGDTINFEATSTVPSNSTSITTGVTYRYTTDGTNPTCATGTAASSYLVNAGASVDLRVIGCKAGFNPSPVTRRTINSVLGAPVFSPAPKDINGNTVTNGFVTNVPSVTVSTVSASAPGAKICYTTNGTAPACDASLVCTNGTGVLSGATIPTFTTGTTLRAITCATGESNSSITDASYTFRVTPLKFTPNNPGWSGTGTYAIGDVVNNGTSMYRALKAMGGATGVAVAAVSDTSAWQLVTSTSVTVGLDPAAPVGGLTQGAKLCYRLGSATIWQAVSATVPECTPVAEAVCSNPASGTVPPADLTVPAFSTQTTVFASGCKAGFAQSNDSRLYHFAPYRHTISTSAGSNDFTAAESLFTTVAGTTGYASWNNTYLYVGLQGPESVSTSSGFLHFYTAGNNAGGVTATMEPGFGTGTLPAGDFTHHYRFRLDSTTGSNEVKISTWNGTSWTLTAPNYYNTADFERGGTGATSFLKLRVTYGDLGLSTSAASAFSKTKLVGAVWSGSANTAGFPQTAAGSGTVFGKYLAIDFTSALNPNTAANIKP